MDLARTRGWTLNWQLLNLFEQGTTNKADILQFPIVHSQSGGPSQVPTLSRLEIEKIGRRSTSRQRLLAFPTVAINGTESGGLTVY